MDRTAALAFPLVAIGVQRSKLVNYAMVAAGGILFYDLFVATSADKLVENYVSTPMESSGAGVRVAMNLVPALIMLRFWRQLGFDEQQRLIWRNSAWMALALTAALVLVSASTAVDRLALYVIPLQLAVLPRAANLFRDPRVGRMIIVLYSLAVQFTWLNFAVHSSYWVPYRLFPL